MVILRLILATWTLLIKSPMITIVAECYIHAVRCYVSNFVGWLVCVLWHINPCQLFNVKSSHIYIYIYIYENCKAFKARIIKQFSLKRALCKQDLTSVPDALHPEHICIWVCLSKARHANHMRSHDSKLSNTRFAKVLQQQPTGNSCQSWHKLCGFAKSYEDARE